MPESSSLRCRPWRPEPNGYEDANRTYKKQQRNGIRPLKLALFLTKSHFLFDTMPEQFHSENSVVPPGQNPALSRTLCGDIIGAPPVQSRKRGKCMSRRTGQNPKVRVYKRSAGEKHFYFQYWIDVPGREARKRSTHVIGPTS